MPGGQPKKTARNIAGLRNQQQLLSLISKASACDIDQFSSDNSNSKVENSPLAFNGLKINYQHEYEEEIREGDSDLDVDTKIALEMLQDIEFGQRLAEIVKVEKEKDTDWVPRVFQQSQRHKLHNKYLLLWDSKLFQND